ncbi:hypothetical protein HWB51_gp126 [Mycobacterium phage Cuke]|uniref:Uncharacterized protein n=1 Tax=Mycobacterium phage Cuke TaxID=2079417 RepID=A0A2L1IWZ2_9CAUD|nr:hypothetical protein HWB51_gp126 [Mycobacterium phage Cuke]AVD99686.1 hypothetical protein SEA_CUKE_70 [Mycobacterium phage Cuke]
MPADWLSCSKQTRKAMVDVINAANLVRNSNLENFDDRMEILYDITDLVEKMQDDWEANRGRNWSEYRDEYQDKKGIYLGTPK